ncbi:MAG TPA: hypothetical protein VHO23_02835 [Candidatus Paceibacterota bacterium]|nr:hypothetical protein [Candidatus Paceibacterota bacterium]
MTTHSTIHTTVMRRVHAVRALRPIVSGAALSSLVTLLALWGIGKEVWVAQVLKNMPRVTEVAAFVRFFVTAFLNTGFVVQALSVLAVAASLWLVRDALRSLRVLALVR